MGNFEKLSVLVIGVIIVMILVVALYTWTDDPAEPDPSGPDPSGPGASGPGAMASNPGALSAPSVADLPGGSTPLGEEPGAGWLTWTEEPDDQGAETGEIRPLEGRDRLARTGAGGGENTPSGRGPTAEPTAERTYTVKPGQTLSHISLEVYGTVKHWPKIAERNNIDPSRLREGTVLIIPALDGTTPSADNKPAVAAGTGTGPRPGADYVVRNGDTIQKISQGAFGTIERWDDVWIANLERVEDPRFLRVGMTLRIPN